MILNKYNQIMDRLVLSEPMRDEALQNIRKKRTAPKPRQWSWEKSLALAASFVIVLTAAILLPRLNSGPEVEGPATFGVTQGTTRSGGSVNKTRQTTGAAESGTEETASQPGREISEKAAPAGAVDNSAGLESVQAIGPQETNSRAELERRMGHNLKMPAVLPFSASQFLYTDYGDGMGGVTETAGGREVETRMAKLSDTKDPSGDYTVYNTTKVKTINGHAVTLKGNDGMYQLAVWNDGVYSYSVRSNEPLTEADITAVVSSMK